MVNIINFQGCLEDFNLKRKMRITFFLFLISSVWSLCPNLDRYSNEINNGFTVKLPNLPQNAQLEKFLLGNFSIPYPVLSSYFAYETRYLAKHHHCLSDGNSTIVYSLNGSIWISGGVQLQGPLTELARRFDQITKEILYSSRTIYLEKVSIQELIDYNFECISCSVRTGHEIHPQIRNITKCNRMVICNRNSKRHVFRSILEIIYSLIN